MPPPYTMDAVADQGKSRHAGQYIRNHLQDTLIKKPYITLKPCGKSKKKSSQKDGDCKD